MKCPYCSAPTTKVLDKRDSEDLTVTRRRRRCATCGARFTTYERAEVAGLILVKKDGRREEFSRAKLRAGITKACAKRPVSADAIEQLVNDIEAALRQREGHEVSHAVVGELVMNKLRELDNVAYIRFASVYRAFADLSSFEEEIQRAKSTSGSDPVPMDRGTPTRRDGRNGRRREPVG
ncbi:MAG TPA: transcriptional regulator NrdR [Chloroflexota bacterium]|nr:transcriptional regulator NrdR [Chloroflexota bacterium]